MDDGLTRNDIGCAESQGADFRKAVDACPIAFWSLTLDGRVEGANRAAAEVCGGESGLHSWRDCWPEEMLFSIDRVLDAARKGQPATFRAYLIWGPRGRVYVETVVTPVLGADGAPKALSACMRDITAEWETAAFLNSVIQLLPMALTVRDLATGRYVLGNSVAEDLFGVEPEGLAGRTLDELLPAARTAAVRTHEAEALRVGHSKVVSDMPVRDAPGCNRTFSSTRVATFDDSGPRYMITLAEDITEAEASAAALRQALQQAEEANRAKDAFLANISHEIRTPLHGIVAGIDMLTQQALTPMSRELVELVRLSSAALDTRLQNILELVCLDQGRISLNPEPFQVGELLRAAAAKAEMSAHAKGLSLSVEAGALAQAVCRGDLGRLGQVLDQLLDNAVKFTDRGAVALGVQVCQGGLRFTVEDSGAGFDEAAREHLFDRFRQADGALTRAQGGIGVGLALARELVGLMGGRIDCRSRPQGGSVFWFDAPMTMEKPAAQLVMHAAGAPLTILVADDHPTNRRVVELVLGALATVRSVNDGREAVEAFRTQTFDLVLMDIQMPNLDGVSAVAEIRRYEQAHSRKPTPIAMLTANTDSENMAASKAAGANRHIGKPFTAAQLLGSVREMLCA